MSQTKRIAYPYVRVSTEEQATDGVSLDAQRAKAASFCDLHGFAVGEVFADEGISGGRADNRPGLQAAIAACCRKKGVLVVYSISRLARNTRDCIEIAERLQACGADLVSITERIDTTTAMGRMFFTITAALAQLERDQISERVKFALDHKRANGERISGRIPYGFALDPDGVHVREDEYEQNTLRVIILHRTQGKTMRQIADILNAGGTRTKGGRPWRHTTIKGILDRLPSMDPSPCTSS